MREEAERVASICHLPMRQGGIASITCLGVFLYFYLSHLCCCQGERVAGGGLVDSH